jgi:pimeloyl-ACP methyl ester carboxylesterase
MPYAENDGARLHWEERGSGSPLLLVMGHTYSSAMWYAARDVLAESHRVITFDNRGTGKSSAVRRISVGDMAADAFAVMDAAGVPSAHLYGVSMGGGIVLEMARQRPDRVRSLVLGCTMAKTPDVAGVPLFLRPLLHLPAPVLFHILKRMRRSADNPHPYGTRASADRVARDQAVLAANPTPIRTSVAQSLGVNKYSISEAEVRALSMPALVVHGEEDAAVPYAAGRRLHELISHSEMLTIPGAGHNYFVAAGDEANAGVLDFLRRVDAGESAEAAKAGQAPELSA